MSLKLADNISHIKVQWMLCSGVYTMYPTDSSSNKREQIPDQIYNLLFMSRDYTSRVMIKLIY